MTLTVQELIEQLMKIENKKIPVYYERDSWSYGDVNSVFVVKNIDGEHVLIN